MKPSTLLYSQSLFATDALEIFGYGGSILVGTIQTVAGEYLAKPYRNKPVTFGSLGSALDYFSRCFPDQSAMAGVNHLLDGPGKEEKQISLF